MKNDQFGIPREWELITEKYENGQKKNEGYLYPKSNGEKIKVSKWTSWFENGQKACENDYIGGQLHGKSIKWWPNGQIAQDAVYIDGKVYKIKAFDENGKEIKIKDSSMKERYLDDLSESKLALWCKRLGWISLIYIIGLFVFRTIDLSPEPYHLFVISYPFIAAFIIILNLVALMRIGSKKKTGITLIIRSMLMVLIPVVLIVVLYLCGLFNNYVPHRYRHTLYHGTITHKLPFNFPFYSENLGIITVKYPYVFGVIHGTVKATYDNGKLFFKINYINGEEHGEYTEFHKNGNLKAKGKFINDAFDGINTQFMENGKKSHELIYDKGKEIEVIDYSDAKPIQKTFDEYRSEQMIKYYNRKR